MEGVKKNTRTESRKVQFKGNQDQCQWVNKCFYVVFKFIINYTNSYNLIIILLILTF